MSKKEKKKKLKIKEPKNAYTYAIIFGIILIAIGIFFQIPGGALTTRASLDGAGTAYYVFDNKYSAIDEYVGGDAYNYIIGATLVAGKISGAMTTKAIFIVGGALCLCFGLTFRMLQKKKEASESAISNAVTEEAKQEEQSICENIE